MEQSDKLLCKNCQFELIGQYCHHCGQKKISIEDKRLKHFVEEFISSLFVADGKILVTFKYLFSKPGKLSKSFVSGATKKYLSPLQLFFFANLIYFLFPVLNTFSTDLYTQLNYQPYSDYTREVVQTSLLEKALSYEDYRSEFEQISNNSGKFLLIVLVIFQALFFRLFFFKRKDLYLTDFLAAASYFISFYILVYLILFPLIISGVDNIFQINSWAFFTDQNLTTLYNLCSVIYLTFLLRKAFSISTIKSLVGAVLSTFFLVPTFIAYRFILFLITHFLVMH